MSLSRQPSQNKKKNNILHLQPNESFLYLGAVIVWWNWPIELRNYFSHSLCSTSGGWDDILAGTTAISPQFTRRTINGLLGGCDGMNSALKAGERKKSITKDDFIFCHVKSPYGCCDQVKMSGVLKKCLTYHKTLNDDKVIMDDLGQRSQTVGSARGIAVERSYMPLIPITTFKCYSFVQLHCINQAVGINPCFDNSKIPSGYWWHLHPYLTTLRDLSYFSWLTPMTNMGASALGAEMMTLLAPPFKWAYGEIQHMISHKNHLHYSIMHGFKTWVQVWASGYLQKPSQWW